MSGENYVSEYHPLDEYKDLLKDLHKKNVSDCFEQLLLQSGVDENENRTTAKKIYTLQPVRDKQSKTFKRNKTFRGFFYFLIAACIVVLIVFIYRIYGKTVGNTTTAAIAISVSVLLLVISVLLIRKKLNPLIRQLDAAIQQLDSEIAELTDTAWQQIAPLLALFSDTIPPRLMEKTYPLIHLDGNFDIRRFDYMHRKYSFRDNSNSYESALAVQSGEINGNPFCFFKTFNFCWGNKVYSGSLQISWTETYYDTDGKSRQRTRHETLHAEVSKPFPEYYLNQYLVYCNEAAPNLVFSRQASAANRMSNEEIEKKVRKGEKNLQRMMRKMISTGKDFTAMGNTEFETLFAATDRNNEVEFRLLFTPVAQREMLKLIKDKEESWGDDFGFMKEFMVNTIVPDHLRGFDLSGDTANYKHFDVSETRRMFNEYNNRYFRVIYFSFAPLLAIPIYQQLKPSEFIYRDIYSSHLSCFAHECAVNSMKDAAFAHPLSVTENILKTNIKRSESGADIVNVKAYGHKTAQRTDYVNVYGGDGRLHSVPVSWTEYISVVQESEAKIPVETDNYTM